MIEKSFPMENIPYICVDTKREYFVCVDTKQEYFVRLGNYNYYYYVT